MSTTYPPPVYDRSQFTVDEKARQIYSEASTLRFSVIRQDWPKSFVVTGIGVFEMDSAMSIRVRSRYNCTTGDYTAVIWND